MVNNKEYSSRYSPLTSGIVGCLSYDYGLHQEKIRLLAEDDLHMPDCFFGFYDCILTIDHFTQKLIITSSGLPEKNYYLREKRAKQRLESIIEKLEPYEPSEVPIQKFCPPRRAVFETAAGRVFARIKLKPGMIWIRQGDHGVWDVGFRLRHGFPPK